MADKKVTSDHIESAPSAAREDPSYEKQTAELKEYADSASAEKHDVSLTAKIENPLIGMSRDQLMADVNRFMEQKQLTDHRRAFEAGALVAQDPEVFENMEELSPEEKEALRRENSHKWSQPLPLYLTIILCSIGACVQGWDQTGANGANLSFPDMFGLPIGDEKDPNYDYNNWIVGLINSAPYFSACFLSCWLCDPLNHYVGRRGTLFISSIFCILAPIGSACAQSWVQLFVCRLLLGFGIGFKETTAPVFAAENAPASIRGAMVMTWQLWTAFGILLGNVANLVLHDVGRIAWRLQFGSAFIPAVPLMALVYFCPESPRWYMKKQRYSKAFKSLQKLRRTDVQAARDLYYIHAQLVIEEEMASHENFVKRLTELFTVPRTRRATLASFVVMLSQQMCGINIISFFSSSIFSRATDSLTVPLLASFGFGLCNFAFAWPAIFTIDIFGRRALLLFTFPQMTWSLLAAGLCFLIPEDNSSRLGVIAFFIYLFTAFYSPGDGPVPFTYSAECFDLNHREIGMAWAVFINNFFAGMLSLTWFRMEIAMTTVGAFGFYAGLNALAFFLILFFLPETKALTLEELDYVFSVPTGRFMSYQVRHSVPHWIKRWVFWQRSATKPPLYDFNNISGAKNYH